MTRTFVVAFVVTVALFGSSEAPAADTGVLEHYLNLDATLPDRANAISPEAAVEAVVNHIADIRTGKRDSEAMRDYWNDYRTVLDRWHEPSTAKPVLVVRENGSSLVARYLVGVRMNGPVGGFWAVDPRSGAVQSELLWTSESKPLWMLPETMWNAAESVNDLADLAELLAPFVQFTTGIPVDPSDPAFTIVDGIVDVLPMKTQEERRERVDWFNETYGTSLKVALKAHKGRRTATSKCMSVAASYLADWWTVRTGGTLPTYVNGVGGQKEYGFNPRLLECLFYARHEHGLIGKHLGYFKTAPFSKDRVTGEPIPYSPRGYARILVETNAGTTPDNLVPTVVSYETTDGHFAMDHKPVVFQIFTTGFFPRRAIEQDKKDSADADFPLSLAPGYGNPVDVRDISRALATWGPLLGQHMGRNDDGSPKTTKFGMGVHAVMVIGTGTVAGKPMLLYRETFGPASKDYLEDSFMGPSFRAMPIEYFYQALAFPHHLYVELDGVQYAEDASLVCEIAVTTNHGRAPVDVDTVRVFVDGNVADHARATPLGGGRYRLWMPISCTKDSKRIEIRVAKQYFADGCGRRGFGVAVERPDRYWQVVPGQLEPIDFDF